MVDEQITQETVESAPTEDVSRETIDVPTPERPEYIPEKFWDSETGEIKTEELGKSYVNLEKFSTGKQEEMRESIMAEIEQEAMANLPENKEAYELPKLVEGVTEEMVEENPLTSWWREKCFNTGASQEDFQDGINQYVDFMLGSQVNIEQEMERLGENANDRVNAVNSWASTAFPPEEFETLSTTLGTSAQGIAVLERIMDMQKSNMGRSEEVARPERELTIDDVKTMMNDKRYFDPRHRDSAYVKQVDQAWARLNNAGKV